MYNFLLKSELICAIGKKKFKRTFWRFEFTLHRKNSRIIDEGQKMSLLEMGGSQSKSWNSNKR